MSDLHARPDYAAMQLAIFRGDDPGGLLWQPRIDWWYKVNKQRGTLPPHLKDASLLDVCDYIHASCRYFLWDRSWVPEHAWLKVRYRQTELVSHWEDNEHLRHTWHTPIGSLSQLIHFDEWRVSSHIVEYRLKQPEDFKILQYVLQDEEWYWDEAVFQEDLKIYGAYGTPQFYFRRSPVQRLLIEEMGVQQAIYFMADHPKLLSEYVEFATAADDPMYEVICCSPVRIVNLGENIDGSIDSPRLIWSKHLVPYYQKRIDQLHAAGKFVSIHADGTLKPLLRHLQDVPYDAIEAPTPLPQGDVTLEQIQEAIGPRVLMDGIPALYFLADLYSMNVLVEFIHELVNRFYPRLVAGVSDEFPPDGDIERAREIGVMLRSMR